MSKQHLVLYLTLIVVGTSLVIAIATDHIIRGKMTIGLIAAYLIGNGLRPFAEALVQKLKKK